MSIESIVYHYNRNEPNNKRIEHDLINDDFHIIFMIVDIRNMTIMIKSSPMHVSCRIIRTRRNCRLHHYWIISIHSTNLSGKNKILSNIGCQHEPMSIANELISHAYCSLCRLETFVYLFCTIFCMNIYRVCLIEITVCMGTRVNIKRNWSTRKAWYWLTCTNMFFSASKNLWLNWK
jgi:hypothetical protein